jgi:SWIM zinc finger
MPVEFDSGEHFRNFGDCNVEFGGHHHLASLLCCGHPSIVEVLHADRAADCRAPRTGARECSAHPGQAGWDLYGDYAVRSASKKTYRVAMRGPGLFDNYCSCPDFAVNTLGTCKHIKAILLRLHRRRGKALDRDQFRRTRASHILEAAQDATQVNFRKPPLALPLLHELAQNVVLFPVTVRPAFPSGERESLFRRSASARSPLYSVLAAPADQSPDPAPAIPRRERAPAASF